MVSDVLPVLLAGSRHSLSQRRTSWPLGRGLAPCGFVGEPRRSTALGARLPSWNVVR